MRAARAACKPWKCCCRCHCIACSNLTPCFADPNPKSSWTQELGIAILLLFLAHCCCLRRSRLSPSSLPQVRCAAACCCCACGCCCLRTNAKAFACAAASNLDCRARSSAGAAFACWRALRPEAALWCVSAGRKSMAQCCCCRHCHYAALLLLLPCRLNAIARVRLTASLFIRSTASSAPAARTWPVGGARFDALLRCQLKRLLLLHPVSCCHIAHASFASCAGAKLPHCFFKMIAGSSTTLPPAAGLLRRLDVGAGKLHARVRSSSHV